ncbi:MAG: hypothetical protein ACNA78_10385, partial [Balneolaceae bacterium]
MEMSKSTFSLFTAAAALALLTMVSCSAPPSDFYELDGVISIDARVYQDAEQWAVEDSFSLIEGVVSSPADTPSSNTIRYQFYIQQPGFYSLWVLAATPSPDRAYQLRTLITDSQSRPVGIGRVDLASPNDPTWKRVATQEEPHLFRMPEPGFYTLVVDAGEGDGVVLSRLHLTLNNSPTPEGAGLSPTRTPGGYLTPIDEKRTHTILLPPARAFLPIVLNRTNGLDESSNRLLAWQESDWPYWRLQTILCEDIRNLRERETDALWMAPHHCSVQELEEGLSGGNRPLLLYNPVQLTNPAVKQIPSPVIFNSLTSVERGVDTGAEILISRLADPRNVHYEIPYPALYISMTEGRLANDRQNLLHELEMAHVAPVVVVDGDIEKADSEVLQAFEALMEWRITMFPMIYSLAHRTRQNGEKPLRLVHRESNAYLFGDTFLMVPQDRDR